MTGKKGEGTPWSRTSIAFRQDILKQALASNLDINEICNQALADATGIYYSPTQPELSVPPAPVIVAKDGIPAATSVPAPKPVSTGIHPVINADDPRSASVVKEVPRPIPRKAPAALPGRVSVADKAPAASAVPEDKAIPKPKKPSEKKTAKTKKAPAIKRFVSEMTRRGDGQVAKEALYQAFIQWCREHRITPVPDRKAVTVALKNQFSLVEKTDGEEPIWINISLR